MKRETPAAALLRRIAKGRSKSELKALFKLIRAKSDAALLAGVKPPAKALKRKGDPLVLDLTKLFQPMIGSSAEKADMLVEHMAKTHKKKLAFEPTGLADAARRLRTHFSDAQIRAGARALVEELAALYSKRETVV